MRGLLALSRGIDAVNLHIGKAISWLIVLAVLVSATNAVIRKAFDTSSNAWLELQWVLFGIVFLLCSPWTLIVNEHIRIDIVNNMLPQRLRQWIDLVGHTLFLLPLTVIMIITAGPFFMRSYEINEQSTNAGGLPQWPSKAVIFIGFFLLFMQAISEIIKSVAVLRGLMADPHATAPHHPAEAEAERLLAEMTSEPR